MSKPFRTRFAPSPTGLLHLGHGYSALLAYRGAKKHDGEFLLRIEDIDTTRCKPEFEEAIYRDLGFLGLSWETPVRKQSGHFEDYQKALEKLARMGVLYPCFCTRAEIAAEIKNSTNAPHGPEGHLYPGTCKALTSREKEKKKQTGIPFALRLDTRKAKKLVGSGLVFREGGKEIVARPETLGDVVLARKDTPTSYHLSVVVDDALQGITHIIRGLDLLHATHIHSLLQALLGFGAPDYFHHSLLVGEDGKRFAKRDESLTLESLISLGHTREEIEDLMNQFGGSFQELPF